ncbi:MAG: porin family protein [Bacteroidales bacterium]
MKKLFPIFFAALFFVQVAEAQKFSYGVKAGVGFSSLQFEDITGIRDGGDVYDLITGDAVLGYHLGVQTQVKIAMVVIKPELYFNAGGGTVEQVVAVGANELLNVRFNRMDLPVLVGVKLGPARINAGPVGSYVISETNELTELEPGYEIFTKSMTWGFQAGVGVDIMKKVSIDARYEGSLSKLGETLTIGDSDFALDARPRQWLISLGVWL